MAHGRVVGVIPARLESERFPGKILAPVCGQPLIQHVHGRLSEAATVNEVLIASDSREVADVVVGFGGRAIIVESPCACGSDRVAAAVSRIEADVVVNLQGDQPLIDPGDIDATVGALLGDARLDMTTLAYPSDDAAGFVSRDVVKVVADERSRALYFSREPVPPGTAAGAGKPLFLHHVGIYCFRRQCLERFALLARGILEQRESLEQMRALEAGMAIGLVVTRRETPAVDRPEDIAEIERLLLCR
jgi:3-deoxy-manno-octulosonate cytidylyltransferase (CMP-KDO synthetase)